MNTFLIIVLVIFGLLQLILFFKIWGMTDDIQKTTRRKLEPTFLEQAHDAFLYGNQRAVRYFLEKALFQELKWFAKDSYYTDKVFQEKADEVTTRYQEYFRDMGVEAPNFEDYKNRENYK